MTRVVSCAEAIKEDERRGIGLNPSDLRMGEIPPCLLANS